MTRGARSISINSSPIPQEFQRLDEIAEAWLKEHAERPDYDWRLQPKDGFNSGGYDWCVANWGTKWPASRVEVEGPVTGYDEKTLEVVFHFDTAWSPPMPVIKRAAELYPALRFPTPLFRVRLLFQRALSLQRGARSSPTSAARISELAAAEALSGSALRFPPHED